MTDTTLADSAPKRGIFIGSKGLRAGWGITLFMVLFVAVLFFLTLALHALNIHGIQSKGNVVDAISVISQEGLLAGALVITTLLTAVIERRPLSQLGFSLKGAPLRLLQGLILGVASLSALIGLLVLCHAIKIGPIALHGADIWRYGWQWGLAFLLVAIFEELAFRGYLMQTLARGLNFRWASVVMGLLFAGIHAFNQGETPIGLAMVAAVAVVFSLSVWKTGTLWWAIGFHAAWDWAQSYLYGVADSGARSLGTLMVSTPVGPDWLSGGATGPEGSVLAFVVMVAMAVVVLLTLRKPDQVLDIKP